MRRGSSRASASPCATGKRGSSVPWRTSVGASIAPRPVRIGSAPSMIQWFVWLDGCRASGRRSARRAPSCGPRRSAPSRHTGRAPRRCSRRRPRRSDHSGSGGGSKAASSFDIGGRVGLVGPARARAGRHERQRRHAVRVPHGEVLRDPASHGEPDDVRALERERVQQPDRVRDQVVAVVLGARQART